MNGLSISGAGVSARVSGISFSGNNSSLVPSAGIVINVTAPYTKLSDIFIGAGFYGIAFQAGASGSVIEDFQILDTMQCGILFNGVNDVYAGDFIVSAPSDYLTFSAMSGDFVVGESVTFGGSGAVGTVNVKLSSTLYRLRFNDKIPTVGQVGTGGTSGKTGTLATFNKSNFLGGIRLTEFAEAIIVKDGDVIGGHYPLFTTATAYTLGARPAYSKFTNVYFDSCKNGAAIDKSVALTFDNCWFSNRPNNGCDITSQNESITFTNCDFINSYASGCSIAAGALHTKFVGCTFSGNNAGAVGAHGLAVAAATTDFSVIGCRIGGTLGFGTQTYGVSIAAGASDRYIIRECNFQGNTSGGISDGGTGVSKFLQANVGFNPRGNLGPPAVAASTVAVNNPYGVDCMVYIAGGTISAVTVNGTATGLGVTNDGYFVPAGGSIAITYTVAPTWKWFGS
jgi:hypothetical protein